MLECICYIVSESLGELQTCLWKHIQDSSRHLVLFQACIQICLQPFNNRIHPTCFPCFQSCFTHTVWNFISTKYGRKDLPL